MIKLMNIISTKCEKLISMRCLKIWCNIKLHTTTQLNIILLIAYYQIQKLKTNDKLPAARYTLKSNGVTLRRVYVVSFVQR